MGINIKSLIGDKHTQKAKVDNSRVSSSDISSEKDHLDNPTEEKTEANEDNVESNSKKRSKQSDELKQEKKKDKVNKVEVDKLLNIL